MFPGRRFRSIGKTMRAHNHRRIWRVTRLIHVVRVSTDRNRGRDASVFPVRALVGCPWKTIIRFHWKTRSRGQRSHRAYLLPSDSDRIAFGPGFWSPWLHTRRHGKSRGGGGDETRRLDERTSGPALTAGRLGGGGGEGKRRILMRPEIRWRHKRLCILDDTE